MAEVTLTWAARLEAEEDSKRRKIKGRYTFDEAVNELLLNDKSIQLSRDELLQGLKTIADRREIKVFYGNDGHLDPMIPVNKRRTFSDELHWESLNEVWLKEKVGSSWRFPNPFESRNNLLQESISPPPKPRLLAQNELILEIVRSLRADPKALPKYKTRQRGWIKSEVKVKALARKDVFTSEKVFNTAWQRLRDEGELIENN
jgi:hypothetical protein